MRRKRRREERGREGKGKGKEGKGREDKRVILSIALIYKSTGII